MSSKKAVAKVKASAVATTEDTFSDDWDNETSSNDLIIPKIMLMQGQSKFVTEGDAKMGDLLDSLETKSLGGIDKPFSFIPFDFERLWIIEKFNKDDNQFSYHSFEPIILGKNEFYDVLEWEAEGETYRRNNCYRFFVIDPANIDGGAMPMAIDFKRTSAKAGKKLVTKCWIENKLRKRNPASNVIELHVLRDTNGKNTYVKFDVKVARDTTKEEQAAALAVRKLVKSVESKVDETPIDAETPTTYDPQGENGVAEGVPTNSDY